MTRSIHARFAHSTRIALLALVALLAALGIGSAVGVAAQDEVPHPIVGTWILDTEAENPTNPPSLAVFTADGANFQADADGSNGYGAWEATGETTANLTVVFNDEDDEGNFLGTFTVRATLEVAADGQSITGSYTGEQTFPDGTSTGQIGPGTVTAERIVIEAPGDPVASFDEAFGAPEATPAP